MTAEAAEVFDAEHGAAVSSYDGSIPSPWQQQGLGMVEDFGGAWDPSALVLGDFPFNESGTFDAFAYGQTEPQLSNAKDPTMSPLPSPAPSVVESELGASQTPRGAWPKGPPTLSDFGHGTPVERDYTTSTTRSIPIPPITVVPRSGQSRSAKGSVRSRNGNIINKKTAASARASKPRTAKTQREEDIAAMIEDVMSRYSSLKDLTERGGKTEEEWIVRRTLRNRESAKNSRAKKQTELQSLQSVNEGLELELYQSKETIDALTKLRDEQNHPESLRDQRIQSLESKVSALETHTSMVLFKVDVYRSPSPQSVLDATIPVR
ncbi:hypothetical protein IAR50_006997 [Cryptococcus sp. DSM 104548]